MPNISAIALFCEDIREEKAGTESLMGILPNTINLPGPMPGVLHRLAIYIRMHIPATFDPSPIAITLSLPDGAEQVLSEVGEDFVSGALRDAVASHFPYAGLISKVVVPNFPVSASGRLSIRINYLGQDYEAGGLQLNHQPEMAEVSA